MKHAVFDENGGKHISKGFSITLDTYADFMPDKSRSEMKKMEGILFSKAV